MKVRWIIYLGISTMILLSSVWTAEWASARCNDTYKKIVATYANLFESKVWCDKTRLIDDLQTGAGRFGITGVRFHYSEELIDSPPTVADLISKVQNGCAWVQNLMKLSPETKG